MFEDLLELYKAKAAATERNLKEQQSMIALVLAVDNLSEMISSKQRDVELLGRLIDQVDRLSKEVSDMKSQLKARQGRLPVQASATASREGRALDNHAWSLIGLMKERPGKYATSELVDMLGLNKTTVISVMKRAAELDVRHIKLTHGKRKKLTLSYTPDEEQSSSADSGSEISEQDRMKLELMAMT
ncbi:MAG TPA: hypothetical protein PLI05_03215 [Methanotrichaceae archaeon]|nr:MAG: hypothetical protein A4E47_01140 [Methanosaeta sp. PtaU1.Bin028]HOT07012.1 hypothetical protein [Methanotrichaceae archaeon]HQF16061.1 hypothetical protein [Methanotrichaceae archaeon]HQI90823.1 hypothetical protein [Methanotrichaceae archaeon]HQJ28220.1 hypothetical protein [Methanotrichaceae archaeon]